MGILSNIFSSGASTLVEAVGGVADSLVTSDEERLTLKKELTVAINKHTLDMEAKAISYEGEITKRWLSDNESIVTRLVRPVSYSAVLILFGLVVMTDGNVGEFTINNAYIPVLETLLATMTVAYFGSRGIEKTAKQFKKPNTK